MIRIISITAAFILNKCKAGMGISDKMVQIEVFPNAQIIIIDLQATCGSPWSRDITSNEATISESAYVSIIHVVGSAGLESEFVAKASRSRVNMMWYAPKYILGEGSR